MSIPSDVPAGTIRDWIIKNAESSPKEVAYIFTDGSLALTWADLASKAKEIAQKITALGAEKGESIAVMMPNSHDAVVNFYGIVSVSYTHLTLPTKA